ncbi:NAD(P)-dependent oxidoreductase [Fictibacillus barbaricus]|uniref:NAD(P)H-binding protein n=1 Tax=Fictibacillus barbaricus TaxID=182136 RepID=A0ABS2Z959_9BACL|nr:NAD(P)H-binding protein [Fictibacillus barbaricus]MBN3544137.1 NAD(P)H-binding protein [Fictibacillus barbaricus]GGB69212.1 oxidoreductase [Fictibacillus barbaricus]
MNKILVLGATGRVGIHIVMKALEGGNIVRAFVRDSKKIGIQHYNLLVYEGNVLNESNLKEAMEGMDVVISSLSTDGSNTLSESIPLITKYMDYFNIKRFITIGTAGILQENSQSQKLRYQSHRTIRKSTRAAEEHHKVYSYLKLSNLDWTIVCPTKLVNEAESLEYRVEQNFLPVNGTCISFMDTADFAYKQTISKTFINTCVGIAY